MADRDFARVEATVKPDETVSGSSPLRTALLVVGMLIAVIMSFGGGYWLGSQQNPDSAAVAANDRLQAQLQAQTKELQMLRQQARNKAKASALPSTEVGDLTFYTDLPNLSVKPLPLSQPVASPETPSSSAPASPVPAASPPAKPAMGGTGSNKMIQSIIQRELGRKPVTPSAAGSGAPYFVQVASFRDADVAAGMQSKLQGAGFASRIQHVDVAGRGTWYRLQVGPYASHEAADAARIELDKKMHMQGIVHRGGS